MWLTKQLLVHIDFDRRKKKILWKTLSTSNCLVTNIIQNSIYVQQKNETHSGLKLNYFSKGVYSFTALYILYTSYALN